MGGRPAAGKGPGRRAAAAEGGTGRGGGERPAAVFYKLERTAKAVEDEFEHTVPCLLT